MIARDFLGFRRVFHARGVHAASIRQLLELLPDLPRELDEDHVDEQLASRGLPASDRTILGRVRALRPGQALTGTGEIVDREPIATPGDLESLLLAAVGRMRADTPRMAIALSGGLDSALLAALAPDLPAYVLVPRIPGYNEREAALQTARDLGLTVRVIEVDAADFTRALPRAIAAIETPLYNLHPVAKLLLADAVRADGIEGLLTGDGADQLLGRDRSADYLPLVGAMFEAAGVRLLSPFLDEDVMAACLALPPDPEKHCLRAIADRHPVPAPLVREPKRGGWAPPMDLSAYSGTVERFVRRIGRNPVCLSSLDDRERTLWTTLALLAEELVED